MTLQIAVPWASLIFQKRFADAVSSEGRGDTDRHRALGQILQEQSEKKIISKIQKKTAKTILRFTLENTIIIWPTANA